MISRTSTAWPGCFALVDSLTDLWIYSLGTALGSERIEAVELTKEFGPVREGFLDKTGFVSLYRSLPDETGLSMAVRAATSADSEWWKPSVDALIYVTSTGDLVAPGNAHLLQNQLGLDAEVLLLDLNDACTGFVRAVHLANSLITSGAATTVLLVLSDTYSKLYEPGNLKVSPLFSDGASVTLISGKRLEDAPETVTPRHWDILSTWFLSEGGRSGELAITRGDDKAPLGALYMNGGGVYNFVLKHLPSCLASLSTNSGVAVGDVDEWYVHQGSRMVVSAVEKTLGVSTDLFRSANYGNTVGSSLPFQLEADTSKQSEQTIGLLAFGVGLTMAGMTVRQVADSSS